MMKTRILIACAIVLVTFGSVRAEKLRSVIEKEPKLNFEIKQTENLRFRLFTNELEGSTLLRIIDIVGNVIHEENVDNLKLNSKLYNLSNLTDGIYFFTFNSGKKYERLRVNIKTETTRNAEIAMN